MDDPVVLALRAAIAAGDCVELRVALGTHLLKRRAFGDALEQFEGGLLLAPTNIEALEGAMQAAQMVGDGSRARAYELALRIAAFSFVQPTVVPGNQPASEAAPERQQRPAGNARGALRLVANDGQVLDPE